MVIFGASRVTPLRWEGLLRLLVLAHSLVPHREEILLLRGRFPLTPTSRHMDCSRNTRRAAQASEDYSCGMQSAAWQKRSRLFLCY